MNFFKFNTINQKKKNILLSHDCRFVKDIPTSIIQSYRNAYGVFHQYRFTFLSRL